MPRGVTKASIVLLSQMAPLWLLLVACRGGSGGHGSERQASSVAEPRAPTAEAASGTRTDDSTCGALSSAGLRLARERYLSEAQCTVSADCAPITLAGICWDDCLSGNWAGNSSTAAALQELVRIGRVAELCAEFFQRGCGVVRFGCPGKVEGSHHECRASECVLGP